MSTQLSTSGALISCGCGAGRLPEPPHRARRSLPSRTRSRHKSDRRASRNLCCARAKVEAPSFHPGFFASLLSDLITLSISRSSLCYASRSRMWLRTFSPVSGGMPALAPRNLQEWQDPTQVTPRGTAVGRFTSSRSHSTRICVAVLRKFSERSTKPLSWSKGTARFEPASPNVHSDQVCAESCVSRPPQTFYSSGPGGSKYPLL